MYHLYNLNLKNMHKGLQTLLQQKQDCTQVSYILQEGVCIFFSQPLWELFASFTNFGFAMAIKVAHWKVFLDFF